MRWRIGLVAIVLISSPVFAAERTVFQIGKPDHDYAEFALAGNFQAYAAKFGRKPIVFEVGRSQAGKDWPFIQPGPTDAWAGSRVHLQTIRFDLPDEPRGIFTLKIEFVDTQQSWPPRYAITVAGRSGFVQLSPGGGDGSLSNPRLGKPQKLELVLPARFFKKGVNEITLACVEGSWVQYDAITLSNDPESHLPAADIQSVSVRPTPLFVRRHGQVCRAVDVAVNLTAPAADLLLKVEAAGEKFEVPIKQLPQLGAAAEEIGIPDSPEPVEVKVTAILGQHSKSARARVMPQRKWKVFVAPSSHTDIGYTNLQPICAERHCKNADTAVDLCRHYPGFAWNLEVAWQAENYFNTRKGELLADFIHFAQQGRIGIQALYCNMLTGLCSPEEACRLTWYAHKVCREHNIPYVSAMISDVPTQEASLPMILANSGIRYFSSGINNDRACTFTKMQNKCPCWWEGPDGSRVLMMYMHGYAQAAGWGLDTSVEAARPRVLANLAGYEAQQNYPYDAVFLHGGVSDNQPLNARLAEVVKQWNDRYEYPKLILCPNWAFFEYIEKHYGDKLPVYRGSAGTYWEDGAGSSAHETTLCRNAQESLDVGRTLLALAHRIDPQKQYSADSLHKAWRDCMLYDEHTWGAYCSITQPESKFTKDQWKIKAQFAADADILARAKLEGGKMTLASLVRADATVLAVFNPSSWPRTGTVSVNLPDAAIADPNVVSCRLPGRPETLLIVKDVPACGYLVLRLTRGPKPPEFKPAEGRVIESKFYRVEFDPASGGITSIRDKEFDHELVDASAPFKLNQYVYVAGGKGSRIVSNPNGPRPKLTISGSGSATLKRYTLPGIGELMMVETSALMTPKIKTMVVVWDNLKRINISNSLTKKLTYDKEGVYFAFPWKAQQPTFRYEAPAAIVNANTDMLPGACLNWFTVQHFVEMEGHDATVAWATPDAPLVCFQDIFRGNWLEKLPMTTGHMYSYVMNNYWHTNYLAGQGGDFTFRYSITSRAKSDPVASAQFGWAASNPLQAVVVKTNPQGPLPAEPTSLVSLAEPNVIVIGTKLADKGTGLVLRLWEVSGQATTAHIKLAPQIPAMKAEACNLMEEPAQPLEVREQTVAIPIRARGLATVRIE